MRLPVPPQPDLPPAPAGPGIRGVQLLFEDGVEFDQVLDTLELARLATEALYGPERLELEARWDVDVSGRTAVIDTSTDAARTLGIVFLGLLKREFGPEAVRVARLSTSGGAHAGTEVPR